VPNPRVAIIGGGISGLATAYFLARQGIGSTLIEKTNRLGGLIRTDHIDGCYLEAGPDSFLSSKPAVIELADELGDLRAQLIPSNDGARRIFIARDGKLVPMPSGMAMMVPGQWSPALRSPLFSLETKLRFVRETFYRPRTRTADISVGEFVADHFGRAVLETAAEPLLTGVYGGDVANLSARSVLPRFLEYEAEYGSLIRGVKAARKHAGPGLGFFQSFRGGMQMLTDSLAQASSGAVQVVHGEATRIERSNDHWRVRVHESLEVDEVVLSCPAYVSAALLENLQPALATELAAIPYTSAVLVTLLYDRAALPASGQSFGFLVPRAERRSVAAVTWTHGKFPEKMSPGVAGARAFLVGADAVEASRVPEADLVRTVESELDRLAGIRAKPARWLVHSWPNSMPQYVLGHGDRRERIRELLSHAPGLHVIGNAYEGVGVPDCVRLAKETANKIAERRSPDPRLVGVMKSN